jgi:hypothetical protein
VLWEYPVHNGWPENDQPLLKTLTLQGHIMKAMMIAATFAGLATATSAFAQTPASSPDYSAHQPVMTQVKLVGAAAQAGHWIPPYGVAVPQETRAQVYQDLVHAEKDGQLAYLNSTVYAHS